MVKKTLIKVYMALNYKKLKHFMVQNNDLQILSMFSMCLLSSCTPNWGSSDDEDDNSDADVDARDRAAPLRLFLQGRDFGIILKLFLIEFGYL